MKVSLGFKQSKTKDFKSSKRLGLKLSAILAALSFSTLTFAGVNDTGLAVTDTKVTVGILHSLTGTMAISETGAQEAEKLAIKQINDMGGI